MAIDILILAVIAAVLIFRLKSLLGTRHGDERSRPNPFATVQAPLATSQAETASTAAMPIVIPAEALDSAAPEGTATTLTEITVADRSFEPRAFLEGAQKAFAMVVTAYAKGDLSSLKSLLTASLFAEFERTVQYRQTAGHKFEFTLHRIKSARIRKAHLGGVMAYVTVAFIAEETVSTRDALGQVIEGDPDRIITVTDLWTFSRDTRSQDPNWALVETASGEMTSH